MTYYLFGSNPTYNIPLDYNSFVPTFYYPMYDNCAMVSSMIFNESLSNLQCVYPSNSLITPEIQISDTKEGPSEIQSENS